MTAGLILNPYSGRGKAGRLRQDVLAALASAGVDANLAVTSGPDHASELARQAWLEGHRPILVAGGDGTIGEVINGLLHENPDGPLGPIGVLPLGTANDLAVNLGLPRQLHRAAEVIAAGQTRRIDLGRVNGWVFANNSAVGLEPLVTMYNIRMTRLRGVSRYLVAAVRAIMSKQEWSMRLEWDGGSYQGPVSLVSVGNCPLTGGLFRMAPAADPADGLLTFVHGHAATRRKMFALLPKTMDGSFIQDANIHQHHTRKLSIDSETETLLQVDGELRSTGLRQIAYEILPGKLDILAP